MAAIYGATILPRHAMPADACRAIRLLLRYIALFAAIPSRSHAAIAAATTAIISLTMPPLLMLPLLLMLLLLPFSLLRHYYAAAFATMPYAMLIIFRFYVTAISPR